MGRKIARWIVGLLFVGHGTQKLFGWFGGHGPEGTGQYFHSLGMKPGKRNAVAAGTGEALGGLLFATGILLPAGAAMITGSMITAIRTVHLEKGIWVSEGGYEYNLVLLAGVFSITEQEEGLGWAIGELAAGAAGSTAILALAKHEAEREQSQGPAGQGQAPGTDDQPQQHPATAAV
jgi:putative oxidoreductase